MPTAPASTKLFHRAWGNPSAPALVCVHGLTRNSLDFAFVGEALKEHFYVLAPDVFGRGESPKLPDASQYNNVFYAQALVAWMDELGIQTCRWLGTSMGGLIGMGIAATAPTRISRMVLNDIGAMIPASARARLKTYVGREMQFANRVAAEARLREIFVPFGLTEERHWQHLINASIREEADGTCHMRYDARIAEVFLPMADEDLDLWPLFNAITCETLLLRGANSDLLLKETAEAMAQKPNVKLVEIPHCGHAPALYSDDQIAIVREFLSVGL
jgi:pimeloyl-ACP methyl ester carboxylesterase